MYNYSFKLQGLECTACVKLARLDLEETPSIESVAINEDGSGRLVSDQKLTKNDIDDRLKGNYSIKEFDEIR